MPEHKDSPWHSVLAEHLEETPIQRLQAATIGIVGAGGIGSNVALLLARSGIGTLLIADGDTVNLSNLNRQAYKHEHIGQVKVLALKNILQALRQDIQINTLEQYINTSDIRLFASCHIILEAVDNPATKRSLTEAFLLAGHTIIATSGMAGWGGEAMSTKYVGSRLYVVGDHGHAVSKARPPMAPRVMMAAALQADTVLQILLGKNT